jgi:hypothetical protein
LAPAAPAQPRPACVSRSNTRNKRQQFNKTLGNFDLVKKKIARMAADVYAMEAMTQVTASLIDRGLEDYMVETAMLKVFTTERLGTRSTTAFQIHGGSAYFDDSPLGRMLRDARINQIGEGSNEVLTSFIALVGCAGRGWSSRKSTTPCSSRGGPTARKRLGRGAETAPAAVKVPDVPVRNERLKNYAGQLARLVWRFNFAVDKALIAYREPVMEMQLIQDGLRSRRWNCSPPPASEPLGLGIKRRRTQRERLNDHVAADLFVRRSLRHIREALRGLGDNDDRALLATADAVLGLDAGASRNGG